MTSSSFETRDRETLRDVADSRQKEIDSLLDGLARAITTLKPSHMGEVLSIIFNTSDSAAAVMREIVSDAADDEPKEPKS